MNTRWDKEFDGGVVQALVVNRRVDDDDKSSVRAFGSVVLVMDRVRKAIRVVSFSEFLICENGIDIIKGHVNVRKNFFYFLQKQN